MRDLHFGEKVFRQRANCGLPLEARETLSLLNKLAAAREQREKAYAALRWIAENDPDNGRTVRGRQGVFGARARDAIEPSCEHCGHLVADHDFKVAWRGFACPHCDCTAYDPEIIYEPGSHNGAARAAHAAVTEAVDPVTDEMVELTKENARLRAKLEALQVEHARLRMQLSEDDDA